MGCFIFKTFDPLIKRKLLSRNLPKPSSFSTYPKHSLSFSREKMLKSFFIPQPPFVTFLKKSFICEWRRCFSSLTSASINGEWKSWKSPSITSILPSAHHTLKLIFANHEVAEFKYIWLRDNCYCPECVHGETRQKLLDTPSLEVNSCKVGSFFLSNYGQQLTVVWKDSDEIQHISSYDSSWLSHYGKILMRNVYERGKATFFRPEIELWDRTSIWTSFPHLSYEEICENDEGLRSWLEMFHKFGIAFIRKVPPEKHRIVDLVNRFAYVKETSYGLTFDVINQPEDPKAHLANSGAFLFHHTDMNYREKSPGMQILHCIKSAQEEEKSMSQGGMSFFVDGFRIGKWMEENEPAAFHLLTTTPVHFTIRHKSQYYSHKVPVIRVDEEGEVTEIHYNNRTMGPLEAPSHVILPFYHSYKIFSMKMRESGAELKIQLTPGDVVAFNNRRVLHGRTAFNPTKVKRHLEGCYVDLDEAVSKYDQLSRKSI